MPRLNFLRPITTFGKCLGLFPYCDWRDGAPKCPVANKIVAIVTSSFLIFGTFFFNSPPEMMSKPKFVRNAAYLRKMILTLSAINCYLTTNVFDPKGYQALIYCSNRCDILFGLKTSKIFDIIAVILAFNLYLFTLISYDIYYLHGRDQTIFYIFQAFESYLLFVTIFIVITYFVFIDKILKGFLERLAKPQTDVRRLRALGASFHNICDLIGYFNQVFGAQLALIAILLQIDIVITINSLLVTEFTDIPPMFKSHICWTITCIVPVILGTQSCENIKRKLKSIRDMCSRNIYRCNGDARNEFMVLAKQVMTRSPKISAAGLQNIDNMFLFNYSNIIVSYLVVMVQLSQLK
ncbi:PREDICTED: uncharacterized protein LOC108561495 [Nicrophorus vespilloides]|uniref:Gustatory receptor n=1 Tax=Nicrophorus vespilloides TaxID=110193 RepID=A0ABM1MK46_NICVS|nr:PREDICTED: uncharacterized protein LOC108561495 [Nicrophorus vespilloides]